jgi:putative sterol carrier protein
MAFFKDAQELHEYLSGVFRKAAETEVGPKLASADLDLKIVYTEPEATTFVRMHGENITVDEDAADAPADVTLTMPADIADKYWRGEYNLAVGLAKGQVKAKGPVNKILKLVPLTKPVFPLYRDMIAGKDAAAV